MQQYDPSKPRETLQNQNNVGTIPKSTEMNKPLENVENNENLNDENLSLNLPQALIANGAQSRGVQRNRGVGPTSHT